MSTTELVTVKKILEDLQDKFGIEDETWVSSYTKTAQSKNITIQEWNRVVKQVSANYSSAEALYTALEESLALFDDRISANETAIENEVERATDREAELDTAITNEVTRATAKDAELNTKIELETARAEGVENALSGRVDTNATNISTNTTNVSKNANAIENILKAISDLEDFDTTHKAEFDAFVEAVNDLLDMDDETLDQYHEVLALIKSNRDTLQYIGTNKIDKDKIADDLKTMSADHVLSANQGVVLKRLITALENALNTEVANRESAVTSEENARKAAIIDEANARALADATHTADISTLRTRLDSLDLPIIQKSLYEHNISIYSYNPAEPPNGDYAIFRCTLYLPFEQTIHFNEIVGALQAFQSKEFDIDGTRTEILVGSYGGVVSLVVNGTRTTYPIDEAIVLDDDVWSLYLLYPGNMYVLQYETAIVYDIVRAVADVAASGGGGHAIIECLELPTETISTTHFYRTFDGKLHWYDGSSWHRVMEYGESDYIQISYGDFTTENLALLDFPEGSRIWVETTSGISRDVTLPSSIRELRLDYDYTIVSGNAPELNVRVPSVLGTYSPCKLTGHHNIALAKGFSEVEGVMYDGGSTAKRYEDCSNIHNLRCIHDTEFVNCSGISNVKVSLKGTFTNCGRISNLSVGYDSTFTNCSYMSNVAIANILGVIPDGTYTNCTNVDSETCIGYASTSSAVQIIRWEDGD